MSAGDVYHYLHRSPTFAANKFDIVGGDLEFDAYRQKIGAFDDELIIDFVADPGQVTVVGGNHTPTMFTGASTVDQQLKHIFGGNDEVDHESDEEVLASLVAFESGYDIDDMIAAGEVLGGNAGECPIIDITEFFS